MSTSLIILGIIIFFSTNDKGDVHDATLWEFMKAVLTGNNSLRGSGKKT